MLGFGTFDELLHQRNSTKYLEIRGADFPVVRTSEMDVEGLLKIPIQGDPDVPGILYDILSRGGKIYNARQSCWDLEDLYFSFQKEAGK